jgi:excisionase family DNA binding protein
MDGLKEIMNTEETAAFLGRTPGAIRNLVMRRKIPFRKAGGRLLFLREEIKEWIMASPGLTLKEWEERRDDEI